MAVSKEHNKLRLHDLELLDRESLEKIKNAYVSTVIFYFRNGDSLNVSKNKAAEESGARKTAILKLCNDDPRLKELSHETKQKQNTANNNFYAGVKMSEEAQKLFDENERTMRENKVSLLRFNLLH